MEDTVNAATILPQPIHQVFRQDRCGNLMLRNILPFGIRAEAITDCDLSRPSGSQGRHKVGPYKARTAGYQDHSALLT